MNAKEILIEAANIIERGESGYGCLAILYAARDGDAPYEEWQWAAKAFKGMYESKDITPTIAEGWFGSPKDPENQKKRVEALRNTAERIK